MWNSGGFRRNQHITLYGKGGFMMGKIVDARGLNCPEPVIMTKKAMDEDRSIAITAIVSNETARENVSKLGRSQGYGVEVEQKGQDYYIYLSPGADNGELEKTAGDITVLVKSSLFGEGDNELGQVLMKSFLYTLNELDQQVKHMIFMNSGVRLTSEGSPVLEHLTALEAKGVEILSCGTCLDFYHLKEKLAVGKVTNMYTAMELLTNATKAITL